MSTSITFEEMEKQLADSTKAAAQVKPEDAKLPDQDDIPESIRGKTAADIARRLQGTEEALRMSEMARKAAESAAEAARSASASAAASAPKVEEVKPMTREDIKKLFEEDPIQAMAMMFEANNKALAGHLESRFGSLQRSTISTAEADARKRYESEFTILGDDIQKTIDGLKDKSGLGTAQGWDELIGFVRGKPGNFEKIIEERSRKADPTTRDSVTARAAEREDVGFTAPSVRTPAPSRKGKALDVLEKEIAEKLNMSEDEYVHWRDIGG